MTTTIEYALMAGASYVSNRPDENKFPAPNGWTPTQYDIKASGFEAISFVKGSNIVISFAGTDFSLPGNDFIFANIPLAVGGISTQLQLLQAAEYYMQVKVDNPNANITLTGHSLGGGLASLIAVFFNETAVTFDQAPFRNSANFAIATALKLDLAIKFPASSDLLAPLDRFILSLGTKGVSIELFSAVNTLSLNHATSPTH